MRVCDHWRQVSLPDFLLGSGKHLHGRVVVAYSEILTSDRSCKACARPGLQILFRRIGSTRFNLSRGIRGANDDCGSRRADFFILPFMTLFATSGKVLTNTFSILVSANGWCSVALLQGWLAATLPPALGPRGLAPTILEILHHCLEGRGLFLAARRLALRISASFEVFAPFIVVQSYF